MPEDLSTIEPGDFVALTLNGRLRGLNRVTRRTTTQIITQGSRSQDVRYNAAPGYPVGQSRSTGLSAERIRRATEADYIEVTRTNAARRAQVLARALTDAKDLSEVWAASQSLTEIMGRLEERVRAAEAPTAAETDEVTSETETGR